MNEGIKARCKAAVRHLLELEERDRINDTELGRRIGAIARGKPYQSGVVRRWLDGRQEAENAVWLAIARVLGVDPGWLCFGEDCAAPMVPSSEKLNEWAALSREIGPTRATLEEVESRHTVPNRAVAGSRRRSPPHPTSARKGRS